MGIGREPWVPERRDELRLSWRVVAERLLEPWLSSRWRAYWDETVRRASMAAGVGVVDAVAIAGLVWIRLLRSILLGKYGSIVLFVLKLYLGVKDEGGFRREDTSMINTGGGRSKSYAA